MSPLLLDHLWQSSVVLAVIGLLTLFFRNNGAHVRHALWTAASVKFLLPFALLNGLGRYLSTLLSAPLVQPPVVQAIYGASQPFSDGPVFVALPSPNAYLPPATLIWIAGIFVVAAFWLWRWRKLRAALHAARHAGIAAPMPVKMSSTLLEPGLIGIFRPVLLLPEGIAEKLSSAEMNTILAHEACHLSRRDNLTAALHMLVEALFWFWPPVWWLGARLVATREQACDEAVLAAGGDPQVYAESILKVCKHYVSSPLACAAGVCGADLKQRMEEIMRNKVIARLNLSKKALLFASAAAFLAAPLAVGVFIVPSALAQASASATQKGMAPNERYTGPLPNKVQFTLTHDERGTPLALMLRANACANNANEKTTPIHCEGDVALSMPAGIATGDTFTFDLETRMITVTGKVVLFAGMNRMNGTLLTLDGNTGVIYMNGQDVKSGYPGMQPPGMVMKTTLKKQPDR